MRLISLIATMLVTLLMAGTAEKAHAGLFVTVTVAPPPLPVYAQPPLPGPGYIWAPGYWAWGEDSGDYYWVPGAWVPAPEPGLVWTPGYWGWSNGSYVWNAGYWGPHIGFYGGIDYGFGYSGVGFAGGYWSGGTYYYNRSVTNTGRPSGFANVYSKAAPEGSASRAGFNGGNGGVRAQPTVQELEAASERHLPPSAEQLNHQHLASGNPGLKLSNNHGRPPIAATAKAGDFSRGNVFGVKSSSIALKPAAPKTGGMPDSRRQNASREPGNLSPGTLNRGAYGNRTTAAHFGAVRDRYRPDTRSVRGDAKNSINPPRGAAPNRVRRPAPPVTPRPGPRPAVKHPPANRGKAG
ncbi:MAG: YXWGXW repeat-containing protein [Rhodomicrobium sp.]